MKLQEYLEKEGMGGVSHPSDQTRIGELAAYFIVDPLVRSLFVK